MEPQELGVYDEEYVNSILNGGFHKLPTGIAILPEYTKWIGTAEFRIFNFLNCTIVRGRRKFDPLKLYTDYYLKGKLSCSWSEKALESVLQMDKGNIRRHTKNLADKGFLVRDRRFNYMTNKEQFIYVIGEVKITGMGNIENIYAYNKLWKQEKGIAKEAVSEIMKTYYDEDFELEF